MQFQKYKNTFFVISNMAKKSIFAQEKSLKLPKMQFSDWKNRIFGILNFFEMAKNVFLHFWNCTFFLILEHCDIVWIFFILWIKFVFPRQNLLMTTCFSFAFNYITKYEQQSIGLQWNNVCIFLKICYAYNRPQKLQNGVHIWDFWCLLYALAC